MSVASKVDKRQEMQCLNQEERELGLRAWIARREGVCPYAPGIARFTHLPAGLKLDHESVRYAASELGAFYKAKSKQGKVMRWMLIPAEEWVDHDTARQQTEMLYFLFVAAYFYIEGDKKRMKAALMGQIAGVDLGPNGEINNPVIGKLASAKKEALHPRSLFCTALAPTYSSNKFYRYAPHSLLVMVYANDFMAKKRHVDVISRITHEMICSNLMELWGEDIDCSVEAIAAELPYWERLIEMAVRSIALAKVDAGSISQVMNAFRRLDGRHVDALCQREISCLPVLASLCANTGQSFFVLLNSLFSGSGLYVLPKQPR